MIMIGGVQVPSRPLLSPACLHCCIPVSSAKRPEDFGGIGVSLFYAKGTIGGLDN